MGDLETMHDADAIEPTTTATTHATHVPGEEAQVEQFEAHQDARGEEGQSLQRRGFRLFVIMSALYLSIFLAALDQTVISTVLPTIAAELHSASGYTWVASAYLLAFAAGGPIWANLSNIWGRKIVLLIAVVWFAASSVVCATSHSMGILITGRALQGIGGGGLLLVNICISDLFSMRERGFWLGLVELVWTVASGTGPVLGGALAEKVSWRWIWWINLPFCAVAFILLFLYLDVHNPRTELTEGLKAIDWYGGFSIIGLTLMLLLGLDFGGETFPWNSPRVICLIVFGLSMSLFFLFSEKKLAKYPLMPLTLLQHRSNVASLLIGFTHGLTFIAAEYYLPLYYQSVKGASPLQSGLMTLPLGVSTSITGILAGIFIHQSGRYRELIWTGITVLTLGIGLFIDLSPSSSLEKIIPYQIIAGIGSGLLFQSPLIALQSLVSQEDTATATSTFEFVRNLATSLSIVVGGVVFQNSMQLRGPHLKASGLSANLTEALSGKAAAANVALVHTIKNPEQRLLAEEAFSWSLRNMWILYTGITACGIVVSMFIGRQTLANEHVETKTGVKRRDQGIELQATT